MLPTPAVDTSPTYFIIALNTVSFDIHKCCPHRRLPSSNLQAFETWQTCRFSGTLTCKDVQHLVTVSEPGANTSQEAEAPVIPYVHRWERRLHSTCKYSRSVMETRWPGAASCSATRQLHTGGKFFHFSEPQLFTLWCGRQGWFTRKLVKLRVQGPSFALVPFATLCFIWLFFFFNFTIFSSKRGLQIIYASDPQKLGGNN